MISFREAELVETARLVYKLLPLEMTLILSVSHVKAFEC